MHHALPLIESSSRPKPTLFHIMAEDGREVWPVGPPEAQRCCFTSKKVPPPPPSSSLFCHARAVIYIICLGKVPDRPTLVVLA